MKYKGKKNLNPNERLYNIVQCIWTIEYQYKNKHYYMYKTISKNQMTHLHN